VPDVSDPDLNGMALKPMNCPGHCLIFENMSPSYKDLPIRLADFSSLHRNEASGALTGLTRVRRFVQDDAHIFCTHQQVQTEVASCLRILKEVYTVLGFSYSVVLSTRPDSYMGSLDVWKEAEDSLAIALKQQDLSYTIKPGDGAFYGPKIDILLKDALNRQHQCGTIQLDFQLPIRFKLSYTAPDGKLHTPVMVHRAILGSIERMMAVMIEDNAGKWPFWLSPRQAIVCTISVECSSFAETIQRRLHNSGYYVDINSSGETIDKKIRNAQIMQYNFILIIGKKESQQQTVNVRTRDNVVHGTKTIDDILNEFGSLVKNFK